jgi:hypothetical protein
MQPNSYALHVGCCQQFKRRLGQRLSDAKQRKKDMSTSLEPGNVALTLEPLATTSGNTGGMWGKKRKPSWIDDDNLDVDIVNMPPSISSGTVSLRTAELPPLTSVRLPSDCSIE